MTHANSTALLLGGVRMELSHSWSAERSTLLPLILLYAGSASDIYRSPVYVCKEWLAAADSSEYWLGVAASLPNGNDTSRLVATAASPKRFVIDYFLEQLKPTQWEVNPNLVVEYRDNTSDDVTSPEDPRYHNLTFARPPPSLPFLQIRLCTAPRFDQNEFHHAAGVLWSQTTRCVSLEDVRATDTQIVLEWLGRDTSTWAGHYGAKVANVSAIYLVHPVPDATVVLNY
ncbi:hypothetical protein SPRG_05251 [Saprolegnia parasitica CBS 223.65]|uniref:Uncharacterized protein n=1 Tax=Saprolegnia parasitica (strain CBS 223.65) TaxID=695850 RepID=A0A067CLH0_SAPPC|nr:hypothetical protein SPRG_05251 [Saprolegnia parasitica CBS 223.65]KDO30060.1 hypothetical protein SPRG_05251 [Saprolegnia parasitica CBS 223.65]|eukprot:XP_012199241.1 hypothetical protein SPRG_05251 [Saprolegnia parasitica CBS 223.65]